MDWFAVQQVATGVWLLAEPGHVNSWLVAGRERAVLIDTGLGIAPIRPVVESLTPLPLSVVNTHAHFDHVGGNPEFGDIAIHELGTDRLRQGIASEKLAGYLRYTEDLIAAAQSYRSLDERFFFLLDDTSTPRPLPRGFGPGDWRIGPSEPTRLLREGDRVDLGGRALYVLHTPGHSPDSISLLDEGEGILFAGDTVNTGAIYAQLPDSNLTDFAASTARLAALSAELRFVCVSHFGRAVVLPPMLREVANAFADLNSRPQPPEQSRDAMNRPVRIARYRRFSILVADSNPG
jgi:glyoxylase-like metal-dependent hydrolase (beta-lactamase superfamily II)